MPRVTIFVREDDMEAFNAIVDRPEWLHQAIVAATAKPTVDIVYPPKELQKPLQVNSKAHSPNIDPATYIDESEMM